MQTQKRFNARNGSFSLLTRFQNEVGEKNMYREF